MARYEFKLPDIGEGIAEAEIVAWHVKVGDTIGEDQQIADMMTDKATVEMESPVAGKVIELAGEVGDQIPIGSVLAVIETEGADRAAEPVADSEDERPLGRRRGRGRRRSRRKEFRSPRLRGSASRKSERSRRPSRRQPKRPSQPFDQLSASRHERRTSSPPPPSAPAPATSASTLRR